MLVLFQPQTTKFFKARVELEDQLEAVKKHREKIPVISIPFLSCEEYAIKEYIRDMCNWGEELLKLL